MFHRRSVSSLLLVAFLPIALNAGGCGAGVGENAAGKVLKSPEMPTDRQAKCKVAKSQSEPLIVEWPDAARARLESMTQRGLIAVRYDGCDLQVLRGCTVVKSVGSYAYSAVTRKVNTLVIKDADELYARMPAGALSLEGKLQSAGQLNVQMTTVGRFESPTHTVYREDLEGDECKLATHVVQALTVGAFTFSAGSDAEVGGKVGIGGAGAGGKSTASREMIQKDGDEILCAAASVTDKKPPDGCGAPFQIDVMPLAAGSKPVVAAPVVPVPVPTPAPTVADTPPPPPPKPIKCKKGERAEDGVCVKASAKKKPASKGGVAGGLSGGVMGGLTGATASNTVTCAAGQHAVNNRCVDDEPKPEPIPEPKPEPKPPPPVAPSPRCESGTHLDGNRCVADAAPGTDPSHPPAQEPPAVPPPDAPREAKILPVVLFYAGIAAGITAVSLGIAAYAAAGDAKKECDTFKATCSPAYQDKRDGAVSLALGADISLGVAAVCWIVYALLPPSARWGIAPTKNGVAAAFQGQFQ